MNAPWIVAAANGHGNNTALTFEDVRHTWTGLAERAERVAAGLAKLGVVRNDIVAARAAPSADFVALLHAVQMLGAALLPLNIRLAPPELEAIVAHARPRLLIDALSPTLSAHSFATVPSIPDVADVPPRKSFMAPARIDLQSPLTIVYTSGTTGVPKGVVLTNASYAASAAASALRLGHSGDDVWFGSLPLFHVGGLALLARSVLEGSHVILEPGFDAARAVDAMERGEATMLSVVPTMLGRLLDAMTVGDVSSAGNKRRIRCVLVGGAPLSPALARRALDAGLPIAATYGMTEACSQIATTIPGSMDAAAGLVGHPLDGFEIHIDNADASGSGEILVRGPAVMRGYLCDGEADAHSLTGGWLKTGDLGRITSSGALAVTGRRDDLLITGGENVSPIEVEQVLDEHPQVQESFVTSIDDEVWGQRIVALIVPTKETKQPSAESLITWCRPRLASYKIPKNFHFTSDLPRTATGKLLRKPHHTTQ